MVTPRRFAFAVPLDGAGCRLDRLLATHVDGLSRTQARVLIDIGGVFVDGKRVKVAGRTLRPGQEVRGTIGRSLAQATKATGQAARARDAAVVTFQVVHEDDAVVVVDKPSGLPVAATAETDRGNLAALLGAARDAAHSRRTSPRCSHERAPRVRQDGRRRPCPLA